MSFKNRPSINSLAFTFSHCQHINTTSLAITTKLYLYDQPASNIQLTIDHKPTFKLFAHKLPQFIHTTCHFTSHFGLRNFRYLDTIKEAVERECPEVVSCADILVLSARDGIALVGGPHIPLKTGRRDGRRSRAEVLEKYLPDHNESISVVLDKFAAMGIDTPGVVALLGAHSVGRTHCVKLVHRLYPEVDPELNPSHVPHMMKKCPDAIPDPKAVQYVRNDRGTPMKLDNNYYRNILDNKGLLLVDHQLAYDARTRPYVIKMAKNEDYFFKEFSRAIALLSENNPLTGTQGEVRKQCNVANKRD